MTADAPPPAKKVLIVDDVAALRFLVRLALQHVAGLQVVGEASSGAEAERLTASLHPDVVLLDVYMPVQDGLETLPRLKEIWPAAQVIIYSGLEDERVRAQALTLGAADFVPKGVTPKELAGRVLEICRAARHGPTGGA